MRKINILDCTLRDGGYYNNWDFDIEFINDYLLNMAYCGVEYIEIGFRTFASDIYQGSCYYSKDTFLNILNIPKQIKIGVMVNASELLENNIFVQEKLEILFPKQNNKIYFVRIACHIENIEQIGKASIWLKENGYFVIYNLMKITLCSSSKLKEIMITLENYPIDVFYFADSLGDLQIADTISISRDIKINSKKEFGIHSHDNMNNALSNSITALNNGVNWIDTTILGMGRGAGNTQTELLLGYLNSKYTYQYKLIYIVTLINKYFKDLKNKYKWGTNVLYFLSSSFNIHPSYIQEMLTDDRYTDNDILAVIDYLKDIDAKSFNYSILDSAKSFYKANKIGKWNPKNLLKGKKLLLIGSGPSVSNHKTIIEHFIEDNKDIIVIALNSHNIIDPKYIYACISCHPVRLLADVDEYLNSNKPLIVPYSSLPKKVALKLKDVNTLDFGINIIKDSFEFYDTYCVVPNSLVLSYSLATATSGEVSSIYLAGFDGYDNKESKNNEINNVFKIFKSNTKNIEIMSLTKTKYTIKTASIYNLIG